MNKNIIVSNVSDESFALGVGYAHSQEIDISEGDIVYVASDILKLSIFYKQNKILFDPIFLLIH